jgi:hypothetical protein
MTTRPTTKSLVFGAMNYVALGLLIAALVLFLRAPSHEPSTQKFAECIDLKSAALELCKAGIELRCRGRPDDPSACEDLTSTYLTITGERPRWMTSP